MPRGNCCNPFRGARFYGACVPLRPQRNIRHLIDFGDNCPCHCISNTSVNVYEQMNWQFDILFEGRSWNQNNCHCHCNFRNLCCVPACGQPIEFRRDRCCGKHDNKHKKH